ncbi:hypothetical protein CBR_g50689 [Chara braunii]|uniref:Uncharacterized protein n=1 Tax=Chara braunii TaxID=69332 RepID=A0A388M7L1_CHABU|nr:hypothetical protein CBR_g50689 [Chara braunii]|eukprot:GBG90442.1 hypothetical protein CBR_g50689 [Chara braunii]
MAGGREEWREEWRKEYGGMEKGGLCREGVERSMAGGRRDDYGGREEGRLWREGGGTTVAGGRRDDYGGMEDGGVWREKGGGKEATSREGERRTMAGGGRLWWEEGRSTMAGGRREDYGELKEGGVWRERGGGKAATSNEEKGKTEKGSYGGLRRDEDLWRRSMEGKRREGSHIEGGRKEEGEGRRKAMVDYGEREEGGVWQEGERPMAGGGRTMAGQRTK